MTNMTKKICLNIAHIFLFAINVFCVSVSVISILAWNRPYLQPDWAYGTTGLTFTAGMFLFLILFSIKYSNNLWLWNFEESSQNSKKNDYNIFEFLLLIIFIIGIFSSINVSDFFSCFEKGSYQSQLKKRNMILNFFQYLMWGNLLFCCVILVSELFFDEIKLWSFITTVVSLFFLMRFENWSDPYWAEKNYNGELEDIPYLQKKLITNEIHQEGDKNPFW